MDLEGLGRAVPPKMFQADAFQQAVIKGCILSREVDASCGLLAWNGSSQQIRVTKAGEGVVVDIKMFARC